MSRSQEVGLTWHPRRARTFFPAARLVSAASACSPARSVLIALVLLATLLVAPCAHATDGHLRITSTAPGALELEHASGWSRWSRIESGTQMIWCLPAGTYVLRFRPDAGTGGGTPTWTMGKAIVWDDLTTRVEIDGRPRMIRSSAGDDDGRGAMLLLPADLLDMLPDDPAAKLAALDTYTRWRPDLALDGLALTPLAERRELTALTGLASGAAIASLSPGDPLRGASHWQLARAVPQGRLTMQAIARTPEAIDYAASGRLPQFRLLGIDLRGNAAVRFTRDQNASPRAHMERVPPHSDERLLDLSGDIEFGPAAIGALAIPAMEATHAGASATSASPGTALAGASASPRTALQGESTLGAGRWSARLQFAASGSQRNHFLEIYRYDSEHAPHEELAQLWGRASTTVRLSERTRAEAAVARRTYQNSLADGVYKNAVRDYYRPYDNAAADTSGLYWQGATAGLLSDPHVFDYYQWKRTEELTGELALTHAAGSDMLLAWRTLVGRTTYRRFDHYSPTEIEPIEDPIITQRALVIGYDPRRGEAADDPFAPGRATSARSAVTARTRITHDVRLQARAGIFAFTSGDSALVSLADPLGGDIALDARDLTKPAWHAVPEGELGLRGGDSRALAWWGLAYMQAHQPPLEALYGPRAYLAQQRPEGVMGNPDLKPERERGGEIGCAFPLPLARHWQMNVAGYAGRIDDAITLAAASIGEGRGLFDGNGDGLNEIVPVYDNGGALRRYGLHLDATTGPSANGRWARVSYDYSRIESDRYEPPLLDLRWLRPDLPQGEYASEGYATPLGGLLDEWSATGGTTPAAAFESSNLDRPHRLSVALITPLPNTFIGADWRLGGIFTFASGRPFSQVAVHPAGLPPGTSGVQRGQEDPAWETVVAELWRNQARMRNHVEIDLALSRRWVRGSRCLTLALETLNLLGIRNALGVYRATGLPDDDGCAGSPGCVNDYLSEVDAAAYAERIAASENYDRPWTVRLRFTAEFFRQ